MRVVLGAAVCTAAYAVMLALGDRDPFRERFGALVLGFWVVCLAMLRWVRRGEFRWRRPVLVVMLAAAVVQLPGVLVDPRTSTDAYRYVWDGRVQLSGTSPYRYAPLDDRLAALRDPVLFPGLTSSDRSGFATQPLPTDRSALLVRARDDPRTRINRPQVPTIYPPVAQAWFTAVAAVTPWSAGTRGLQVGSAGLAVLIAGGLARLLHRRGVDPGGALWWAWCPTVILEAGNGGHVDIVAAALVLAGVLVFSSARGRRRGAWGAGLLLGLAASVKLTPLVVLPALVPLGVHSLLSQDLGGRERLARVGAALRAPVTAVVTLGASYLPHAVVAGWLVVGYLPGYLSEEGGDQRAAVLGLVPAAWRAMAMLVVMAATAIWGLHRVANRGDTALVALVLFGMLLLTTTPSYPWYAVPLVALAVLADRLEWLAVGAAGYLAYGSPTSPPVAGIAYAVAAVVVVVTGLRRTGRLPGRRQPISVGVRTGE